MLQAQLRHQTRLLTWLHGPALFLSGLGYCRACSLSGCLIPSLYHNLLSTPAGLCAELWPLHTRCRWLLGTGFTATTLRSALVPQLRFCSPNIHKCTKPGPQNKRKGRCTSCCRTTKATLSNLRKSVDHRPQFLWGDFNLPGISWEGNATG